MKNENRVAQLKSTEAVYHFQFLHCAGFRFILNTITAASL